MNLVNYSDNDSDNESESTKQQETKLPAQTQADNVPPQAVQLAKKKRCAGVLSIMQSIANGNPDAVPVGLKSMPHKKQKKEEEEKKEQGDEDNNVQDHLHLAKDQIVKREGYEINDLSRIRNVPHMDGQFACYIYIDITTGLSSIVKAQKNFKERVIREYPNYKFEDVEPENFHVSLSKTFYLNRHQIEPFMTSLTEKYLKGFSTMSINIDLNRLKVFCNEDRNRFFIAASVGQGKNVVREIVDGIDNCLQAYGLDTFFKGNKHHVSLLWTTNKGCQSSEFKLYVKDNRFNSAGSDGQVTFEVKDLQIKIGNRVTSIPLQPFHAPKE